MIVVTGHIELKPENVTRARPHMRAVLEGTRKEKGCLLYAYGEDVLQPGMIRIVERWQDWPSLEAHDTAQHVVAWRKALAGIGVVSREVTANETGKSRAL